MVVYIAVRKVDSASSSLTGYTTAELGSGKRSYMRILSLSWCLSQEVPRYR